MFKQIVYLSVVVGLLFSAGLVLAQPDRETADLNTLGTSRILLLPPAADNSSVISLGSAVDPQSGEVVEGYAILHPKNGKSHKFGHNGGSAATNPCYRFFAKGSKWKNVEPWLVNTTNSRGLASNFVLGNLSADIAKWEDAADGVLGNSAGVDILGNGTSTAAVLAADTVSPDGSNEVYFADISSSGSVAVTIVWGIFSGPTFQRKLVEWDQIYDDIDFDWSSTGEAGKIDFENVAVHELGHSIGLSHPDDSCTEESMYRFVSFGEIKKRSLNAGDIAGTNSLY